MTTVIQGFFIFTNSQEKSQVILAAEPVRSQLCLFLRKINETRAAQGFEPLRKSCIRLYRRPVKVFQRLLWNKARQLGLDDGDEREPIKPLAR